MRSLQHIRGASVHIYSIHVFFVDIEIQVVECIIKFIGAQLRLGLAFRVICFAYMFLIWCAIKGTRLSQESQQASVTFCQSSLKCIERVLLWEMYICLRY